MATVNQITEHAKAWIDVANAVKSAFTLSRELSLYNSVNDPGWSTLASGVPLAVDADGLVVGTQSTPQQISDAIGSINNFVKLMDGTDRPAQSAWINNVEKIAKPIV